MSSNRAFDSGMLAGILFMVAASAGHWLITPASHPDATTLRVAAVVVQAVGSLVFALILVRRHRSRASVPSAV